MQNPPRAGGVQSVHRALDILEIVGRGVGVGVRQIAEETGLPVSTAHGLLSTLTRRGYVMRAPRGYVLGPSGTSLSLKWDPASSLPGMLERVTSMIAAQTRHAATGTVLAGSAARVLAYSPAPGPITVGAPRDVWRDPLSMSTGRLLVALGSRDRWDAIIAAADSPESAWTHALWHEELEGIRQRRVATRNPSDPRAESSIAVAITAANDRPVCAVGCSTPSFMASDLYTPRVYDALEAAATFVATELGLTRGPRPDYQRLQTERLT